MCIHTEVVNQHTHLGVRVVSECTFAQRSAFTSLKLSCLYILACADQPMCVQPVQNTLQEDIVLEDTTLLYTKA
jgi:hypothetical protein